MESQFEVHQNQVVVIGGGITGLSSCWYLDQMSGNPPNVTLVESNDALGGKMITRKIEGPQGTFVIDAGPESFVTRKTEAWDLARELDLDDQIIDPGSETKNMYVLDGGTPKQIPLSPLSFILSNLMSFSGKLRMIMEPFIPPRRDWEDESLAEFVTRRLGVEALEKMIGPVLAGIYNADPNTQSILTTSPVMREMERDQGGLFRGALARMRAKKKSTLKTPRRPQFMTFSDGSQTLIDRLQDRISARILTDNKALSVTKADNGYQIKLSDGQVLSADAVILALPGNQASKIIADLCPDCAELIQCIPHKNIGTATFIYRSDDLELPYKINGLMIPRREDRKIDAITWTSNKPIKRSPAGFDMIRIFFGGASPQLVSDTPENIIRSIKEELKEILDIQAEPVDTAIFCWQDSFPQANVGHLDLVNQIDECLPAGIYAAGSSYRGIGIPDCVRQGRDTARKVKRFLE